MSAEYSELTSRLEDFRDRLQALCNAVAVDKGLEQIDELEGRMATPGFWDNNEKAQGVIRELKTLRSLIVPLNDLSQTTNDLLELTELAQEEEDPDALQDLNRECDSIAGQIDEVELRTTLNGKHDSCDAFISIHAGAGGTESCDWASILSRMLERYCEKQGFKINLVDRLEGEEAGIKSVTYQVKGDMAYGYLRSEIGVHRLVRKSPFDASNRRHTSFAAVDVIPEMSDIDKEVEILESDLRIDTYRAGGAGGQHVNVTDSAVRITHVPTGIVVQCQNERSQHANKATALKVLKSRIILLEEMKREEELQEMYGEKGEIAFGSQIRSYVLEPYTLAKDRRTGHETGNVQAVLDGELLPFVEMYLHWKLKGGKPRQSEESGKDD
ncbi:MAG: peptide chain release factor 2 [Planctomycetota bacterium]|nr:peptide chain release factor 2 [Planctomycetota bacterium]